MIDDKFNSELLKNAAARLMEHFDTVQIFATIHESSDTSQYIEGQGNYFARKGQIQYWLEREVNRINNIDNMESQQNEEESL